MGHDSAEELQGVMTRGLCNGSWVCESQCGPGLDGTRVPDGAAMHWLSDMSQVLVLHMEFRTCSLYGMINERMALWL